MSLLDQSTSINHSCASSFIEALVASGIQHFVICPGSRNTPLIAAIDANPTVTKKVHYDERGAAFYALGMGKATGKPACLVVTSGTAGANAYPAIIEARTDHVPLIVITADRPSEMVELGYNQTIDQIHFFGSYPLKTFHLPTMDSEIPSAYLATIASHATSIATTQSGPVHLNFPCREPFNPLIGLQLPPNKVPSHIHGSLALDMDQILELNHLLKQSVNGLILLGKEEDPSDLTILQEFLANTSWPIFSDPTSALRTKDSVLYDQLLTSDHLIDSIRPDSIIHLGGRMNSKNLHKAIQKWNPNLYIHVSQYPNLLDPDFAVTHTIHTSITHFCSSINPPSTACDISYTINSANQTFKTALKNYSKSISTTENEVANTIAIGNSSLPTSIFAGTSMPIRLFDAFFSPYPNQKIFANRGASGIDGLLATTVGIADASNQPITLVIGDNSLLHDLNSLALLKSSSIPITVIVFNNDGGSIFKFLPIGKEKTFCNTYHVAPHGLNFKSAADMYGIDYHNPSSLYDFTNLLNSPSPSSRLIELTTNGDATKQDMEWIRSEWKNLMR